MSEITLVDENIIASLADKNRMYGLLINTIRNLPSFKQFQQWHDLTPNRHCMYTYLTAMLNNMGLIIEDENLNIPASGPCILIGNHPTGMLEVMVWLKTILGIRKDIKFLANHWFDVFPLARNHIIKINPFEEEADTKQNFRGIKEALRHLNKGGALMIMPAGEVAHWNWATRSIEDPPWKKSVLSLAKFKNTPIIPCFASGHNSLMFNLMGMLHPRFRTMMLIKEFVDKQNTCIELKTGPSLTASNINVFKRTQSQMAYLRLCTQALNSPIFQENDFSNAATIIDAIAPNRIEKELSAHQPHFVAGNIEIYCIKGKELPATLKEIGRLREVNYRQINEGSGSSCDIDQFDDDYYQVFAWDKSQRVIHGALRLGMTKELGNNTYFQEAVHIKPEMQTILKQAIDFGRFFVSGAAPKDQNILLLLIRGLLIQMQRAEDYRYLIGQVSIPSSYPKLAIDIIVTFLRKYCTDKETSQHLSAKTPYHVTPAHAEHIDDLILDFSRLAQLKNVLRNIYQDKYILPPLLRFYVQCNAQVLTFNHDKEFGCVDALMIMDRYDLPKHFSF